MVHLARVVYGDSNRRHPAELLDRDAFPRAADIERHLLAAYLPAAYQQPSASVHTWSYCNVRTWLTGMAQNSTPDLEWWRVRHTVPLTITALVYLVVAGLAVGLPSAIATSFSYGRLDALSLLTALLETGLPVAILLSFATHHDRRSPAALISRWQYLTRCCFVSVVAAFAGGAASSAIWATTAPFDMTVLDILLTATNTAVQVGLLFGIAVALAGPHPGPSGTLVNLRGGTRHLLAGAFTGGSLGLAAALCYSFIVGASAGIGSGVRNGFTNGIDNAVLNWRDETPIYCLIGAILGMAGGLTLALRVPLDVGDDVGPFRSLTLTRNSALFQMLFVGAVSALLFGAVVLTESGPSELWLAGPYAAVIAVLFGMCSTVWGQWVIIVRLWLPLTGRLPWRLPSLSGCCETPR